jgi:hypothetical protein
LFEAAHAALGAAGVRVPQVLMLDSSKGLLAGDVAVVEDVRGGTLEALWGRDPNRAKYVLARLSDVIAVMHRTRRDRYGRPGAGQLGDAERPEQVILRRALDHLSYTAACVEQIAAVRHHLADLRMGARLSGNPIRRQLPTFPK